MENANTDLYFTKDLSEASAILCNGAKLIRLEQEQKFYWFVYSDKPLCEQLSNSYWSGELQVSAKAYSDALKTLKNRLFSRG